DRSGEISLYFRSPVRSEISSDISHSTRFARSGQALNMADAPPSNGCNGTLPLDMTETKTLLEVVQSTAAYFKNRQVENPRLNAEHLLAHLLGLSRMDLYLEFERDLSE